MLNERLLWHGQNRQRLDRFILEKGRHAKGYDPSRPPVAVFDWDNTIIENDIGDLFFLWMVRKGKIRMPCRGGWRRTSSFLTHEAIRALDAACGRTKPCALVPTDRNLSCADEISSIYLRNKTASGQPAFSGFDRRWTQASVAWGVKLEAGYTPDQIRGYARRVITSLLAAPRTAVEKRGILKGMPAFIRIYKQILDLIETLRAHGFSVYVVSASPQHVLEPFAARLGFPPERVIGARTVIGSNGRLTHDLKGCGPFKDDQNLILSYRGGKRCWINKVIFGIKGAKALLPQPDPAMRPVLVAGDSTTDLEMLTDSSGLKLVINRHHLALMCHALHNRSGQWLINPKFLSPLPRRKSLYPCSSTACSDAAGLPIPCKDEVGKVIPDQRDRVF